MIILKGKVRHTTHSYTKLSEKKKVEKERQQRKLSVPVLNKQRTAKACTKLSDNLYSVSSPEEAHKLSRRL